MNRNWQEEMHGQIAQERQGVPGKACYDIPNKVTGWRGSAMAVRRAAITILICIVAIAATTSMFVRVAAAQGVPGFAIVFGGWAVLPYFALIAAAATAVGRPFVSLVIAVGSVFVAAFGLLVLHGSLSFFFAPLPPGAGQCAGPIVEMIVPLIQWLAVI